MAGTATLSLTNVKSQANGFYTAFGTLTISAAGTYTAGGIPLSLFNAAIKATQTPLFVIIKGQSGFIYDYVPGSDASLGKMKCYSAYNTEVADAGSLTGQIADTIVFEAIYLGMW